jgi:hypothetical protein
MNIAHEVKVGVMRYLDGVAMHLSQLTTEEREAVIERLYAALCDALRARAAAPSARDLRAVLAQWPPPSAFAHLSATALLLEPLPRRALDWPLIAGLCSLPLTTLGWMQALLRLATIRTAAQTVDGLEWVLLLVGVLAPLVTTWFGLLGLAHCRLHPEGAYQLPLALGLALVFPLLLLDGLCLLGIQWAWGALWRDSLTWRLVVYLSLVGLDVYVVQRAWQSANRHTREGPISELAT